MAIRTLAFTLGALLVICQHGAVEAVAPGLQDDEAVSALTAARTAIRGDTRPEMRVDSLTLVGSRTGRSRATGMVNPPDPFELRVLLPDNYLRINTGRMAVNWSGFRGDVLISNLLPTSSDVRISQSVLQPENVAALLREHRAKFTALVLGMLAETAAPLSLEIRGMSQTDAIVSITFRGTEEFSAVLDVDTTTGLPVRVRHDADVRFPQPPEQRQNPPPSAGGRRVRMVTMPPRERMEVAWMFDEWRPVADGLRLPHRITFSARGLMLDEYQIETIQINQLGSADFNP